MVSCLHGLLFVGIATFYVRPEAWLEGVWGGYADGVGFFLVGILLLGFGAAAVLTCFMWSGDQEQPLVRTSSLRRCLSNHHQARATRSIQRKDVDDNLRL